MNRSKPVFRPLLVTVLGAGLLLIGPLALARMNKTETQMFQQTVADLQDARARLERLEQLFHSSNIQQMYLHMQDLENENRRLRGELESLLHRLEKLAQREKEINLDMDKRLQALESRGVSSAGMSSTGTVSSGEFNQGDAAGTSVAAEETYPPDEQPVSVLDEQSQYRQSFDFLKSGQYAAAVEGFQQFLQAYPDSTLASNARYWLGEAHYGAGQFEKAADSFKAIMDGDRSSTKAPDARLKLGFSLYELGKWPEARKVLQSVLEDYPDTSVARFAEKRLKRMKSEGH